MFGAVVNQRRGGSEILEVLCLDAARRAGTMVGLEIPLRSWCEFAEWWLIVVVRKVGELMDYGSEGP